MSPQSDLTSIDTALPVTMLPVRIEMRFAGTPAAPQLQVRLYPDDAHIHHHDPRLTASELAAGTRYWTSLRAGAAADVAWAQLLKEVGPARAIWTRQALTPTNTTGAPTFPDAATVDGSTGLAATARALPGSFIVRVRHAGGATIVQGRDIPTTLQVGVSFGDAPTGATPAAPAPADGATRVLDEGMRWMVDFDAAVAVGMAVTVDLPAQTSLVQDVVAVGVPAAGVDGAALLATVIESHRLSDGAAFIAPGTPTNNLADSASGYSIAAVPPPIEPVTAPAEGSVAAVLAAALAIDPSVLAPLDGAASRELDEARLMSRALFEATWGSFLRQQGQPGFDLNLLPQVYAHVTSFVRGGGPLPPVRLGRQPYGIVPVMARGAVAPVTESVFQRWLHGFLPRIRPLWTSGVKDQPSGPDLFAQEPVSTRVRLRTTNMSAAVDYMVATGNAVVRGNPEVSRRTLFAEVGFTGAMPSLFTQIFPKAAATLWLPMTADHDTQFNILAPAPKDANSVLGLLLRNSARRIAANVTNEFASLAAGQAVAEVARAAPTIPIANLPAAAGRAIPALAGFEAATTVLTPDAQIAGAGRDASGATFTIRDRLADIVGNAAAFTPDFGRYFNSDALAAFRDALAPLAGITTARRAVLTGEIIDCASHRYDAWVTSLASARLAGMQASRRGNQVGAWGAVRSVQRREVTSVPASDSIPEGTVTDPSNGGFVMAPSPRQASTAGVLRAAWRAHGGASSGALAPFATDLTSTPVRRALTIADGMRHGQQLGALLGYLLERGIHDASGVGGVEIDWVVFELRRQYPLKVDTIDNAPQASAERLVADGWKLAQVEAKSPGAVVSAIPTSGSGQPPFGPAEKRALQAVIADVVAALDAFSDLGLAESMYQLAGANLERAAAASDMMGRAAVPPDVFESVSTPRGGRGIEQRVIVACGAGARPAGYATDTPRAHLAPAADAFVARRLGPLGDIRVRLLDASGEQAGAPTLSSLGLSALDLAALDLSSENITLSSGETPETMPGAPTSNPGRQGVARLLLAANLPGAVTVDFDRRVDADLLDLLDHAAAWQRVLAGRKPLTAQTFVPRAELESLADTSGLETMVASLATELSTASTPALKAWGIAGDEATARAAAAARVAAASTTTDPVKAAGVLLGGPAVVEGSLDRLPADIQTALDDQTALLGSRTGVLARWLQDSARVRTPLAQLNQALLRADLAAGATVKSWAGQSPAAPFVDTVAAAAARSWVGLPFPGALAAAPIASVVIVGDDASGAVTGIELDAWTEVVPDAAGTAAVTANLAAPDARAPNVILLAVPPDSSTPWTQESLLSVVDEAMELADCRMVDLDATRRVPALLPAIYLAEFDENDVGIRRFLSAAADFPVRWVAKETP